MKHLLCCDHMFSNKQNTQHSHFMDGKDSGWARAQLLWCHTNHMLGHVPGTTSGLCRCTSYHRRGQKRWTGGWLWPLSCFAILWGVSKIPNSGYHTVIPRQGAWGITSDQKYSWTARKPEELKTLTTIYDPWANSCQEQLQIVRPYKTISFGSR